MSDLSKSKELLNNGNYTCVICKGEESYTSTQRGVKPLVAWYEEKIGFNGFSAADKVVGKGAAFLYVLLGLKAVYAGVISKSALNLLQLNNIGVEYGTLVNNIINRTGDGICPFESAVLDIEDSNLAYKAIRRKMCEMNIVL